MSVMNFTIEDAKTPALNLHRSQSSNNQEDAPLDSLVNATTVFHKTVNRYSACV